MYGLPENLPVPQDDGRASHLKGVRLPAIELAATTGESIDLSKLPRAVVFCYPLTARPGEDLPKDWNDIPGARGCTPEVCRFTDLMNEFRQKGWPVFGLSTQSAAYQLEMAERLHVPYPILSDHALAFASALKLPLLKIDGMSLMARLTMIIVDHRIEHVFYPIFPPDTHADEVLAWIDNLSDRG
jgi:peroxiredoxin